MAYTNEQLALLEEAISQGVLIVEYSDKKVTYRSLKEMKQILSDMKAQLGITTQAGGRKYGKFYSGL